MPSSCVEKREREREGRGGGREKELWGTPWKKKKKKSVALQKFLPLKVSVKAAFPSEALDEKARASRTLLAPGKAFAKDGRERERLNKRKMEEAFERARFLCERGPHEKGGARKVSNAESQATAEVRFRCRS